ncbi:MAG: HIT family protein [Clostridium sp.]|jgi:histidine triad (HIT) family protein|nr:HIT family protein [Clostridium sp.]
MKRTDCIFCKIAKGELPARVLYEDEDFLVIMDQAPVTKGHALILPKEHVETLYELSDEMAAEAVVLAKRMIVRMKEKLQCDGFNILQNNGEAAGQTVPHFHMHLIPRYQNDGQDVRLQPDSLAVAELDSVWKKIK